MLAEGREERSAQQSVSVCNKEEEEEGPSTLPPSCCRRRRPPSCEMGLQIKESSARVTRFLLRDGDKDGGGGGGDGERIGPRMEKAGSGSSSRSQLELLTLGLKTTLYFKHLENGYLASHMNSCSS